MTQDVTREEAVRACKNGAIAALVMALITMAVVTIAMMLDDPGPLALWKDPENTVDVLILFACAWGMYRCSRAAAVVAIVYILISTAFIYLYTGQTSGFFFKALLFYFFVMAARGAWNYHRLEAEENPDYQPSPKWLAWVGIPLGVIFAGLSLFGLLTMTPLLPSTNVISGDELSADNIQLLVDNNVLYEDETVELFYSEGVTSIMEGGSVLSNRAVIAYGPDEDGEMQVWEFEFADIVSVEQENQGSTFEDAMFKVSGAGEDNWIRLILSTEDDGHLLFIERLKEKMAAASPAVSP